MNKIEIVSYLIKSGRLEDDEKNEKADGNQKDSDSDSSLSESLRPRSLKREELRVIKSV
jgi:hypothetical protein